MKSLANYIMEGEKTYEFKIKIADLEVNNEVLDRIEHALSGFGVKQLTKPKALPITATNRDFPSRANCQVTLLIASLTYPCTDEQIRANLGSQGRLPLASIVVTPKNQPEEIRRDEEDETTDNKKALLTTDLENVSGGQPLVGTQRLDSFIKELNTRKYEFAGDTNKAQPSLADQPQNNVSPTGKRR